MNFNTTDIFIISAVAIITLIFIIVICSSDKKKTKQQQIQQQAVNPNTSISLPLYIDIFNLFKEANRYVASIQEIRSLIENSAEVSYTILKDTACDKDFKSFDNLKYWLISYERQLSTYICMLTDIYDSAKFLLKQNSATAFELNLQQIRDYYNETRNFMLSHGIEI